MDPEMVAYDVEVDVANLNETRSVVDSNCLRAMGLANPPTNRHASDPEPLVEPSVVVTTPAVLHGTQLEHWWDRWGVWHTKDALSPPLPAREVQKSLMGNTSGGQHLVRLCIGGEEVRGCFHTRQAALTFHAEQLRSGLGWPRQVLDPTPERSPFWDHPEDFEEYKEYSFNGTELSRRGEPSKGLVLSVEQQAQYENGGFLIGLPILGPEELSDVLQDFEELLRSRIDRAPSDAARFRAAHTISRPLHQTLVQRLAKHKQVLSIVEDILGPRFVCWSAHLFCKLPGDPTEQPWHQDSGFWPLSRSRALTVWIAFDDVDAFNAPLTFVEGSHRLGRILWQSTNSDYHLLTAEIPDVDLLGPQVSQCLRAGEASVHSDLTVHGSHGNSSSRRRAGLALRYVGTGDAKCIGPMINGYQMNAGCILPKGKQSDPHDHWHALRRRPGGKRAPRFPASKSQPLQCGGL